MRPEMVSRLAVAISAFVAMDAIMISLMVWDSSKVESAASAKEIEQDGGHAHVLPDGRLLEYFSVGSQSSSSSLCVVIIPGSFNTGRAHTLAMPPPPSHHSSLFFLSPSVPGFGGSSPSPNIHSSFPHDVAHLLHALNIHSCVLVGGSYGGLLAIHLASQLPSHHIQVLGLLVGSPPLPPDDNTTFFPGALPLSSPLSNRVLQQWVLPSPIGESIVRRVYGNLFRKSASNFVAAFGEEEFEGQEKMMEEMRRSIRWSAKGQCELLRRYQTEPIDWKKLVVALRPQAPVSVWAGGRDKIVSVAVSQHMVECVRKAGHEKVTLTVMPQWTHFSLRLLLEDPLKSLLDQIKM